MATPLDDCTGESEQGRLAACNKALSNRELSDEDRAAALNYRALAYHNEEKYVDALKDIKASIEIEPDCDKYFLLGVLEDLMGRKDAARDAFEKALREPTAYSGCENLEEGVVAVEELGGALPDPPGLDLRGEGSMQLDEIEGALAENNEVLSVIKAELRRQNLDASDVLCVGRLVNGEWVSYYHERVAPFECEVGDRSLVIDGTLELVDPDGKIIDPATPGAHLRDDLEIRYSSVIWNWR
jgi:tetratricopeptide (TPR) repeat protein